MTFDVKLKSLCFFLFTASSFKMENLKMERDATNRPGKVILFLKIQY